jgi:hypothetical protein
MPGRAPDCGRRRRRLPPSPPSPHPGSSSVGPALYPSLSSFRCRSLSRNTHRSRPKRDSNLTDRVCGVFGGFYLLSPPSFYRREGPKQENGPKTAAQTPAQAQRRPPAGPQTGTAATTPGAHRKRERGAEERGGKDLGDGAMCREGGHPTVLGNGSVMRAAPTLITSPPTTWSSKRSGLAVFISAPAGDGVVGANGAGDSRRRSPTWTCPPEPWSGSLSGPIRNRAHSASNSHFRYVGAPHSVRSAFYRRPVA